ncbi:cytochrome P450 [Penicillium malachiteum]|uniref:Cytochrome P450 monooxygenase poxM n=1 Tax=Penicillium malachiteum TaxID=1324776 RepID=A0AAD6HU94_9EURO|nr:cytochrome P450 [Penicillium malachiteum]
MGVLGPMAIPAVVAGIFSHLAFFRIGEHHMYSMQYFLAGIAVFCSLTFIQIQAFQVPTATSAASSCSILGSYLAGVYTSLIAYRLLFHPLRHFAGPLGCKISSVWFSASLGKYDAFHQLAKLHDRYGLFLRIGSNDLSVAHPKAVQAIYGPGSKCHKAPWYDSTQPIVSLHSTRDKSLHERRRRVWSRAFGEKNLRDYETRMTRYRSLLIKNIDMAGNEPLDISKLFNIFTFDVMGDLAFGASFGMLETSKEHGAITLFHKAFAPVGFMLPVWLFRFMTGVPGLAKDWWGFITYCTEQVEKRIQMKSNTTDIMSSLLRPLNTQALSRLDWEWLQGDSQLIIVAGSDTASATLTNLFRYLVDQPQHINMLRAEVDDLPRTELGDYLPADLKDLGHLNGVINETMRLYPPVPSAIPRLTPPEGLTIEGTFIPGNTTVYCPQYVLGRNPDCYINPNEFIPERWYSRPDLMPDASSYVPFSIGTYGCIGKPLAMMNLRATVARIVADFDVQMAPGTSLAAYDQGMKEHFTLAPSSLNLCFRKRV